MRTKKKIRSKQRKASARSSRPVKNASSKKLRAKTKAPKKPIKNKGAQRKAVATTGAKRKKPIKVKTTRQIQKRIEDKSRTVYSVGSSRPTHGRVFSGRQSGDLQGLSRAEEADSESVEELLEEGNPFEAEVVTGVESADEADEREVRTHEVPEDDV